MVDNTEADDDGESHGRPESEWVIFKEKKCVNLKPFLWECWCASETKENNKTNPENCSVLCTDRSAGKYSGTTFLQGTR